VTRLCDDGHQTQIITSRKDLSTIEVAYRAIDSLGFEGLWDERPSWAAYWLRRRRVMGL
jgi:hypothetical protein